MNDHDEERCTRCNHKLSKHLNGYCVKQGCQCMPPVKPQAKPKSTAPVWIGLIVLVVLGLVGCNALSGGKSGNQNPCGKNIVGYSVGGPESEYDC